MGSVVYDVIGSIGIFCTFIYIWSFLLEKKINYKNIRFFIIFVIIISIIMFNFFYNIVYLRILFITVVLGVSNYLIFSDDVKKIFISTVLSEFIFSVADISFGIIVIFLLKIDINNLSSFFGTFIANIYAFIVSILIVRCKYTKKLFAFLMKLVNNINRIRVIFLSFIIIISLNLLLALVFFKLNTYCVFIINIILILIYSLIIVKNLETSSRNSVIKTENESLMESLHQYEEMVDRQRVDNHENKNQLLIIKNMIKKKDKDVIKYIDTVVKDQMEDDEALYTRVMTIPSGGLQGIIYQKMLVMKDERIQFSLDVSRDVRNIKLESIGIDDNYRLCKIIGVFLDNAIEESKKINDRRILISLYVDNEQLVIEVSNKFSGKIDLERLDESGYTTKGDGHGYGLTLVREILSESSKFENERSIKRNVFKQVIRVKIKNT